MIKIPLPVQIPVFGKQRKCVTKEKVTETGKTAANSTGRKYLRDIENTEMRFYCVNAYLVKAFHEKFLIKYLFLIELKKYNGRTKKNKYKYPKPYRKKHANI